MLVLTVRCSLDLSTELSELSTELRTANILAKFLDFRLGPGRYSSATAFAGMSLSIPHTPRKP